MLSTKVFTFLKELESNNNREWFLENKERFQAVQEDVRVATSKLLMGLLEIDKGLTGLEPKNCLFRIYRDVRFSKDKSPYKTNLGAFFVEGGKKSGNAGYYLHIQPGECFIGGGVHVPPGPILKAVRTEIYNYPEDIIALTNKPDFKKVFGEINGDKLKKVPQGFDKEFEHAELLKFKSFTVGRRLDDNVLTSDKGLDEVLGYFKIMKPFIGFLNRAIKENT